MVVVVVVVVVVDGAVVELLVAGTLVVVLVVVDEELVLAGIEVVDVSPSAESSPELHAASTNARAMRSRRSRTIRTVSAGQTLVGHPRAGLGSRSQTTGGGPMVNYPKSQHGYISLSYRYLRLAMVVLVLTLGASLAGEIIWGTGWLGSISAYYYTPVHSIFVGMLVAIGVSLIALKGRDSIEDMFFNIAGVLAPVVALVPTTVPNEGIEADETFIISTTGLVRNNVPAFLVGLVLAIAVGFAKPSTRELLNVKARDLVTAVTGSKAARLGGGALVLMLVGGVVWYFQWSDHFEKWAHGTSAIAMFFFIWCAVLVNIGAPRGLMEKLYRKLGEDPPPVPQPALRRKYMWVAIGMAGTAIVIGVTQSIEWDQRVFWLEAIEIALFARFWVLQTYDGWEHGTTCELPHTHPDDR